MRKTLLSIIVCLFLITGMAYAESPVKFSPLNLQGDTLYLIQDNRIAAGIGVNIASALDGVLELRAEYVTAFSDDVNDKFGAGVGVNLPKLLGVLKGNWLVKGFNPSIGVIALVDIAQGIKLEFAPYISIVKVEF